MTNVNLKTVYALSISLLVSLIICLPKNQQEVKKTKIIDGKLEIEDYVRAMHMASELKLRMHSLHDQLNIFQDYDTMKEPTDFFAKAVAKSFGDDSPLLTEKTPRKVGRLLEYINGKNEKDIKGALIVLAIYFRYGTTADQKAISEIIDEEALRSLLRHQSLEVRTHASVALSVVGERSAGNLRSLLATWKMDMASKPKDRSKVAHSMILRHELWAIRNFFQ